LPPMPDLAVMFQQVPSGVDKIDQRRWGPNMVTIASKLGRICHGVNIHPGSKFKSTINYKGVPDLALMFQKVVKAAAEYFNTE